MRACLRLCRTGIGERIRVLHRQTVDDVAHRELGELAGERTGEVRHGDDLRGQTVGAEQHQHVIARLSWELLQRGGDATG